jgi:hypothetical protein
VARTLLREVEHFVTRFVRVRVMEFHDLVVSIREFCSGEPAELIIGVLVARPAHAISQALTMVTVVNFAVDDLSDLIFELAIDFNRWGRGLNAVWKGVGVSGFEEVYMEHIMKLVHGTREAEAVCMSRDLLGDGEGAKFLVV